MRRGDQGGSGQPVLGNHERTECEELDTKTQADAAVLAAAGPDDLGFG